MLTLNTHLCRLILPPLIEIPQPLQRKLHRYPQRLLPVHKHMRQLRPLVAVAAHIKDLTLGWNLQPRAILTILRIAGRQIIQRLVVIPRAREIHDIGRGPPRDVACLAGRRVGALRAVPRVEVGARAHRAHKFGPPSGRLEHAAAHALEAPVERVDGELRDGVVDGEGGVEEALHHPEADDFEVLARGLVGAVGVLDGDLVVGVAERGGVLVVGDDPGFVVEVVVGAGVAGSFFLVFFFGHFFAGDVRGLGIVKGGAGGFGGLAIGNYSDSGTLCFELFEFPLEWSEFGSGAGVAGAG